MEARLHLLANTKKDYKSTDTRRNQPKVINLQRTHEPLPDMQYWEDVNSGSDEKDGYIPEGPATIIVDGPDAITNLRLMHALKRQYFQGTEQKEKTPISIHAGSQALQDGDMKQYLASNFRQDITKNNKDTKITIEYAEGATRRHKPFQLETSTETLRTISREQKRAQLTSTYLCIVAYNVGDKTSIARAQEILREYEKNGSDRNDIIIVGVKNKELGDQKQEPFSTEEFRGYKHFVTTVNNHYGQTLPELQQIEYALVNSHENSLDRADKNDGNDKVRFAEIKDLCASQFIKLIANTKLAIKNYRTSQKGREIVKQREDSMKRLEEHIEFLKVTTKTIPDKLKLLARALREEAKLVRQDHKINTGFKLFCCCGPFTDSNLAENYDSALKDFLPFEKDKIRYTPRDEVIWNAYAQATNEGVYPNLDLQRQLRF